MHLLSSDRMHSCACAGIDTGTFHTQRHASARRLWSGPQIGCVSIRISPQRPGMMRRASWEYLSLCFLACQVMQSVRFGSCCGLATTMTWHGWPAAAWHSGHHLMYGAGVATRLSLAPGGFSGIAASQCALKSWCTMLGMIVVISARWRADAMMMQSPLCTPAVTASMTALADSHAGLEPRRWAGGTAVRSCQTEVMTWRCDDDNWDLMLTEAAAKTTAGTSPRGHAEPTLVEQSVEPITED